jgi:hypothetical protein
VFRRLGAKADPWQDIDQDARPLRDAWSRLGDIRTSRAS